MKESEHPTADKPVENQLASIEMYRSALQCALYEGNLIWLVFSAMAVANGILLGMVGAIWEKSSPTFATSVLITAACALGIAICRRWHRAMIRMFKYYTYWWSWAQECEQRLSDLPHGLTRSIGPFSRGNPPAISSWPKNADGAPDEIMDEVDRAHRNRDFAQLVPCWFGIVHGAIILLAIIRFWHSQIAAQ